MTAKLPEDRKQRVCHVCGKPYHGGRGYCKDICTSCYITQRRQRNKVKAVAYLGGCCLICGYSQYPQVLQFHHVDPSKKLFAPANNYASWKRFLAEIDKCVLLCANCHIALECGLIELKLPEGHPLRQAS